jgi:heme oxygenase
LYQDLLSLGMTEVDIATLPLCGHLPAIPSLPRALGVLYVIDGVALGERIAATPFHIIGDRLGVGPSHGGSFFSTMCASDDSLRDSYRQEFIAMTESMEEFSFQTHAIEAAVDTLDCLEAWLEHRYRPRPANYPHWNSPSEPKLAPSDFTMALSPGNERPAETSSKERIWEPHT